MNRTLFKSEPNIFWKIISTSHSIFGIIYMYVIWQTSQYLVSGFLQEGLSVGFIGVVILTILMLALMVVVPFLIAWAMWFQQPWFAFAAVGWQVLWMLPYAHAQFAGGLQWWSILTFGWGISVIVSCAAYLAQRYRWKRN